MKIFFVMMFLFSTFIYARFRDKFNLDSSYILKTTRITLLKDNIIRIENNLQLCAGIKLSVISDGIDCENDLENIKVLFDQHEIDKNSYTVNNSFFKDSIGIVKLRNITLKYIYFTNQKVNLSISYDVVAVDSTKPQILIKLIEHKIKTYPRIKVIYKINLVSDKVNYLPAIYNISQNFKEENSLNNNSETIIKVYQSDTLWNSRKFFTIGGLIFVNTKKNSFTEITRTVDIIESNLFHENLIWSFYNIEKDVSGINLGIDLPNIKTVINKEIVARINEKEYNGYKLDEDQLDSFGWYKEELIKPLDFQYYIGKLKQKNYILTLFARIRGNVQGDFVVTMLYEPKLKINNIDNFNYKYDYGLLENPGEFYNVDQITTFKLPHEFHFTYINLENYLIGGGINNSFFTIKFDSKSHYFQKNDLVFEYKLNGTETLDFLRNIIICFGILSLIVLFLWGFYFINTKLILVVIDSIICILAAIVTLTIIPGTLQVESYCYTDSWILIILLMVQIVFKFLKQTKISKS